MDEPSQKTSTEPSQKTSTEPSQKTSTEPSQKTSTEPSRWDEIIAKYDLKEEDARSRVFALSAAKSRNTPRKVEEAIAMIGSGSKGASVQAICNWILNNYATLDPSKLRINVKKAVLKGLKEGKLVRAKSSKKALGVCGTFTFPEQKIKLKTVRMEGKKYAFPILQTRAGQNETIHDETTTESEQKSLVENTPDSKKSKKRPPSSVKRSLSVASV